MKPMRPETLLSIINKAEDQYYEKVAEVIDRVISQGNLADAASRLDSYIIDCEAECKRPQPYQGIEGFLRSAYQRKIDVSRKLGKEEDARVYEQKLAVLPKPQQPNV
jgi:hypothetical protein